MSLFDELRPVVESGERAVVFTVVGGDGVGAKLLVREDGSTTGDASPELALLAPDALRRGHSHIVEQNANVSLSIADRGYVLSTGRLVLEGKAEDLREDEGLRKAYLGR